MTGSKFTRTFQKKNCALKALAVWIAAFPFATQGVQSTISSLIGTISFTAVSGKKRCASFTRPIIFRSSPDEFVPPPVRRPACSASMSQPSQSSRLKKVLLSEDSRKASFVLSRRNSEQERKLRLSVQVRQGLQQPNS